MRRTVRGFTLIELLVVLAILAMLLTLALPRYFGGVEASREAVLRHNLKEAREVIDRFKADTGRYPDSLHELVARGYLRSVPVDPITESDATWEILPPQPGVKGNVFDLRSAAPGQRRDGGSYRDW